MIATLTADDGVDEGLQRWLQDADAITDAETAAFIAHLEPPTDDPKVLAWLMGDDVPKT